MELTQMMEIVSDNWRFDCVNYPIAIRLELDKEKKKLFAIGHILMHQQKAAAKLAEVCEVMHGQKLDEEKLKQAVGNFFINTLRLINVSELNKEQLSELVMKWAFEKQKS